MTKGELILKLKIKIGILIACVCGIGFIVIHFPWNYGFVCFISLHKLTSPPACYFNLTEEDLNKYPVLKKLLDKIEKENKETVVSKEIDWKKGEEIYDYICSRIKEETGKECEISFLYEDQYYRMRFAFT
jgi:hypothetical protein